MTLRGGEVCAGSVAKIWQIALQINMKLIKYKLGGGVRTHASALHSRWGQGLSDGAPAYARAASYRKLALVLQLGWT